MNDPTGQSDSKAAQAAGDEVPNRDGTPYHHKGGNMPEPSHHDEEVMSETQVSQYWRANVRLLCGLLAVWFVVSFGAGILFVGPLNNFQLGGYPLGFWFAQQGSIYAFVGLIFYYAWRIKIIERRLGVDDDE